MGNKFKYIFIFLFIFVLVAPLAAQERNNFTQRLEWSEDDYAYEYKVEVRSSGKSTFYNTEENFIDLKLSAGNYEYRVFAYDFLGRESSVSEWVKFSVLKAKTPVIKELKSKVVLSDVENTAVEVPLEVSAITEETEIVLVNKSTKETVSGQLEIIKENDEVVASKAVFPEVSEGEWYAKVINPSGLYSETPVFSIQKDYEALKAKEEAVRLAEEKRQAEEAIRLAEEKRQAEEAIRLAEEKRQAEEAVRLAEEKRQAEEAVRLAEEKRQAEEAVRLAEEKRQAEEAARLAEEQRINEELAYQDFLKEEQKRQEEAALAERLRIEEEIRLVQKDVELKEEESRLRTEESQNLNNKLIDLEEELQQTKEAIAIAEETGAPEKIMLEERAALLEERIKLAQNAARLAAISATYAQESLRITNDFLSILPEESAASGSIDALKSLKVDADNYSELAQKTFEQVEEERIKLDKELEKTQDSIDKKVKKLLKSRKPAKNINILAGGDFLYSPYDKNLFSYIEYPFFGAIELQFEYTPFQVKENLLGFNLDFEISDFFSENSLINLHIPMIQAELGFDFKKKLFSNILYADFTLAGGIVAFAPDVSYLGETSREELSTHFYMYPCASVSAGLYLLPAKHFAIETGGRFTHKFISGMPTGTLEGYVLIGLRL